VTHPRPFPPAAKATPDATALIPRPLFAEADDGDGDDWSSEDNEEGAREQTAPHQRAVTGVDAANAPTGRFEFDDIAGYEEMPSAHVSVFDVSDIDGEVEDGGAATTIMQLPPSMMRVESEPSFEELTHGDSGTEPVELMKWRAGPAQPAPPRGQTLSLPDNWLPGEAPEHVDDSMAATLPALSLDAVRAAVEAVGMTERHALPHEPMAFSPMAPLSTPMPIHLLMPSLQMSAPPMPMGPMSASMSPVLPEAPRQVPGSLLSGFIEDALSAVLAAQSSADSGQVPRGLHDHLARAVELLSMAQELIDRDDD
jgi:hypothetical protein